MFILQRANYQTMESKNVLIADHVYAEPVEHGWQRKSDGLIEIKWTTLNAGLDSLLEFMVCNCKKIHCKANVCKCKKFNHKALIFVGVKIATIKKKNRLNLTMKGGLIKVRTKKAMFQTMKAFCWLTVTMTMTFELILTMVCKFKMFQVCYIYLTKYIIVKE